jgi:hypothetical protein
MMKKISIKIFNGFPAEPKENYWRYPRALDGFWCQLSGTEQKILDYIIRHTWGYTKNSDKISLSQFKNGMKNRKTGLWVDKGTGIKKNETILKATKELEKMGFIRIVKTRGKITEYKLKLGTELDNSSPKNGLVDSPLNGQTIKDNTIINKQYAYFKKRPTFMGMEMRRKKKNNKWYCIPNDGGNWLEFVGKESEIQWK